MPDGTFEPGWKEEVLRITLTDRRLWVGVASRFGREDGVPVIEEETDPAYGRVYVTFSPPQEDGLSRYVENVETIRFPPYARDARVELGWWFVASEPVAGDVVVSGPLKPRDGRLPKLESGDELVFRPGDIRCDIR